MYPQFGTINLLSNFNHNTWHSGNITVEKRYGKGLMFNASYNYLQIAQQRRFAELLQPRRARRAPPMTSGIVRRVRDLRTAGRQRTDDGSTGAES